jgi:hypothetical protein
MAGRQGKVRPEYELWYPRLSPETWYPAAWLRETVLDQLRRGEPRWDPQGRALSDEHFEFRGGERAQDSRQRRRQEDLTTSSRLPGMQPDSGVQPNA